MKRIISLALVVLMAAALFVGCSGDSAAGTYKLKSIDGKDPKTYFSASLPDGATDEDINALLAMSGLNLDTIADIISITLKDDGSVLLTSKFMSSDPEGLTEKGTWKQDGEKITITLDESKETEEFTLKNGELSATIEGLNMTLVKAG